MSFRLALIQMKVTANKQDNLAKCKSLILKASKNADIVVLPECFNQPYGMQYFQQYAEPFSSETAHALSTAAKDAQVYIVGGSFIEQANSHLFNSCTVWNPKGELIGTHRKVIASEQGPLI
jgi:omega-amidase